MEVLPECKGCGRTYAYHVGAMDLSHLIAANAKERARRKRMERMAATMLQKRIRGIRDRKLGATRAKARLLYLRLLNRAAILIQSQYRGHLDRRTGITKLSLQLISKAHTRLHREALRNRFGARKVFWFKRKAELKLLFQDYRVLVQRLGNKPDRLTMEWNCQEIARRIFQMQTVYAIKIQRLARGIFGRILLVPIGESGRDFGGSRVLEPL